MASNHFGGQNQTSNHAAIWQAKIPFDEEELAYIASLDAAADAAFLEQELPWLSEGSLRTLQVLHLIIHIAISHQLAT